VSGRRRGAAFAAGALVCAALAAAATGGDAAVEAGGGALRPVVVTRAPLAADAELTAEVLAEALEVRRVPEAFAPPDALADPADAGGLRAAVPVPAGAYLTASMLERPGAEEARVAGRSGPAAEGTPVELAVTGAGALMGGDGPARRVDVVVSGGGGPGPARRAYVAARDVALLDLRRARAEPGLLATHRATLALTRAQALRLIRAESEGATIRLLAAR